MLSIYQTDIIVYGADLADYITCEFARCDRRDAADGERSRSQLREKLVG